MPLLFVEDKDNFKLEVIKETDCQIFKGFFNSENIEYQTSILGNIKVYNENLDNENKIKLIAPLCEQHLQPVKPIKIEKEIFNEPVTKKEFKVFKDYLQTNIMIYIVDKIVLTDEFFGVVRSDESKEFFKRSNTEFYFIDNGKQNKNIIAFIFKSLSIFNDDTLKQLYKDKILDEGEFEKIIAKLFLEGKLISNPETEDESVDTEESQETSENTGDEYTDDESEEDTSYSSDQQSSNSSHSHGNQTGSNNHSKKQNQSDTTNQNSSNNESSNDDENESFAGTGDSGTGKSKSGKSRIIACPITGRKGEEIVNEVFKNHFKTRNVKWLNEISENDKQYDFIIYEGTTEIAGKELYYFDVKATKTKEDKANTIAFFISEREWEFIKDPKIADKYYIARVFDIDAVAPDKPVIRYFKLKNLKLVNLP